MNIDEMEREIAREEGMSGFALSKPVKDFYRLADGFEIARLEPHFAEVRAELLAADVSRLDAGQLGKRAQHIARLQEYVAGRGFPHNHDRAERTPFFVDSVGLAMGGSF